MAEKGPEFYHSQADACWLGSSAGLVSLCPAAWKVSSFPSRTAGSLGSSFWTILSLLQDSSHMKISIWKTFEDNVCETLGFNI